MSGLTSNVLLSNLILGSLQCIQSKSNVYIKFEASQISYHNSIIKFISKHNSLAECGAFCSATPNCSAWKNTPEVCTLLDSTEIFPAQDGPTEVVNIDASRQPVFGHWSEWSAIGECPVTCGFGQRVQYRSCDNPAPAFNGPDCPGSETKAQECNLQKCLGTVLEFPGELGDWGPLEICSDPHDYVTSFQTRAQVPVFLLGDDVGMNEIHFLCSNGESLRSYYSEDDIMGGLRTCSGGYSQAKVKMELNASDNSGANCIQLFCEEDKVWHKSSCSTHGTDDTQSCAPGERICGLQTRFDFTQDEGMRTTLNDIIVQCCSGLPVD